jgi:hypothetical protein
MGSKRGQAISAMKRAGAFTDGVLGLTKEQKEKYTGYARHGWIP